MPLCRSVVPFSVLIFSLAGCGGGSSSNTAENSLSGRVADGYIQGAIVCLDRNENLQCDAGEPKSVSDDQGAYTLNNIPADEQTRFRVVAEVPAGAIDADMPDTPIGKPYFLTAPIGKHALLTPITTLMSEEMHQHPYLTVEQAAVIMAARLQISPSDLWHDYNKTLTKQDLLLQAINNSAANRLADDLDVLRKDPSAGVFSQKEWRQLAAGRTLQVLNGSSGVMRVTLANNTAKGPWSISSSYLDNIAPIADTLAFYRHQPETVTGLDIFSIGPWFDPGFVFPATCVPSAWNDCSNPFPTRQLSFRSVEYAVSGGLVFPVFGDLLYDPVTHTSTPAPAALIPKALYLDDGGWSDKSPMLNPIPAADLRNNHAVRIDLSELPVRSILPSLASLINRNRDLVPDLFSAGVKFPSGAGMMRGFTSNKEDTYVIGDSIFNNNTFDYPFFKDKEVSIHSLDDLISRYATNTSNRIHLEAYKATGSDVVIQQYTIQFGPNHSLTLALEELDGSDSVIRKTAYTGGTWDDLIVHGKRVIRINRPYLAPDSQSGSLFFTMVEGGVVEGRYYPKGDVQEVLLLNAIAMDAFKSAYQP